MKFYTKHKNLLSDCICFLFAFMFLYTAISKFLIFHEFELPIEQDFIPPLLAKTISWCVPILELTTTLLLIQSKFRLLGLYIAFTLMVLFATYITIILNLSNDTACKSCGGILSRLSWTAHFSINIIFIGLSFLGVMLKSKARALMKSV